MEGIKTRTEPGGCSNTREREWGFDRLRLSTDVNRINKHRIGKVKGVYLRWTDIKIHRKQQRVRKKSKVLL